MNTNTNVQPKLFPLTLIDSRLTGYYFDTKFDLWTRPYKSINPAVRCRNNRTSINGLKVNMQALINKTKRLPTWESYIKNQATTQTTQTTQTTTQPQRNTAMSSCYVVALIENNVPRFSKNPKVHTTKESAIDEVHRLVTLNPGVRFGYFGCCGTAISSGITWSFD